MSETEVESPDQQDSDDEEELVWKDYGMTRREAVDFICKEVGCRPPPQRSNPTLPKRAMNSTVAYLTGSFEAEPRVSKRPWMFDNAPDKPQMRAAVDATARGILAEDGVWEATEIDRPLRRRELNRIVSALKKSDDKRGWLGSMDSGGDGDGE